MTARRHEPRAAVSKRIQVAGDIEPGLGLKFVGLKQIGRAGWMDVQERNHRGVGWKVELDVVGQANVHGAGNLSSCALEGEMEMRLVGWADADDRYTVEMQQKDGR
jgi:hypothetical protein